MIVQQTDTMASGGSDVSVGSGRSVDTLVDELQASAGGPIMQDRLAAQMEAASGADGFPLAVFPRL